MIPLAFAAALAPAFISPARAGDDWSSRWSAGIYGGYALSTGDWKDHHYAEDVRQFNTDFSMTFDISLRLSEGWGLDFQTIYLRLNTNDWEDYVQSLGDRFSAQAGCLITPLVMRYAAWSDVRNQVSLLAGMGLAFGSGKESYNGISYDYDFLRGVDFAAIFGSEYNLMLKPPTALAVRGSLILIPSGVHYANERGRTIVAFPISVGLRFFF